MVHDIIQKLRTPSMDSVMVAVTEMGDVQVLLPVILAALSWFVWHRLWQTGLYWLAAIGLAEILVKVLKVMLHRPRPSLLYDGVERFSFPSGHATMSVVVYGFLAFLICRKQRAGVRTLIALATALVIALIAFSRLYLGAHWASDVIAGMSFALAWIGALALAYTYRTHENVKPKQLALLANAGQPGLRAVIRNRSALPITETELRLIASAAIIGERSQPVNGNSTPAASGTPSML